MTGGPGVREMMSLGGAVAFRVTEPHPTVPREGVGSVCSDLLIFKKPSGV